MPTKDELTAELAETKQKLNDALAAGESAAELTDSEGDELVEGELYFATDAGLVHVEGPYAAEGKAVTLTEDGAFHVEARALPLADHTKGVASDERWDAAEAIAVETAGGFVVWDDMSDEDQISATVAALLDAPAQPSAEGGEADGDGGLAQPSAWICWKAICERHGCSGTKRDLAVQRLSRATTLHGSVDALPPVV